jgi:hypothetical protein
MASKTTILTAAAAAATLVLLGIVAVVVRETRTKQSITRDWADDPRRHRHQEVLATEFAPRSHGGQGEDDQTGPR